MTYSSVVLADTPYAYWRLGESAGSTADNAEGTAARDGTYTGGNTPPVLGQTGALAGDSDTAIRQDADQYSGTLVSGVVSIFAGTSAWSIEGWINHTPDATVRWLFRTDDGSSHGPAYLGSLDSALILGREDASAGADECVPSAISSGWHHIVGTFSGTQLQLYVDGEAYGSAVGSTRSVPTPTTAGIGFDPVSMGGSVVGYLDEFAVYADDLTSSQVAAHYAAALSAVPVWTTPADTVGMSATPELKFNSPDSAVAQHFYLQLDTADTFNTGNLRTYDSSTDQTNWAYWDGDSWEALPSGGLPSGMSGNEVRFTVTSALSAATWYRRVRAGTLT